MAAPRDPVADLRRIAFLLERGREATYRVRAFRTAAAALQDRDDDDVVQRALAGTLTALPGLGEVTARCVTESLAGEKPGYLRRLEDTAGMSVLPGELSPGGSSSTEPSPGGPSPGRSSPPGPLPTGSSLERLSQSGAALRDALRGDCHTHSDWSDGGSPIEEMAATARELGHDYLVLTDHSPRLTVANGLSAERLRRQLDVVAELNETLAPFRILTGIEVDILLDGTLDQQEELLAQLDVVVASVHSKLRMPEGEMTQRMLAAVRNPHVDVLGHCTGRLLTGKGRPESQFDAAAVFAACAEHGVAVEVNSRPERLDPPKRLLRLAVQTGCLISIDTDAHAPGQLDWLPYGCERAAACDVPPPRVVNTWASRDLLDWANDHTARPANAG
ncbi:MAG: PHP domain-containing protein [Actinomycetota bacterium]|nr:PHP domain-containing protein [Actinomycetota bacterium]